MTRVNLPDSLLTELRDIKRRLRALETSLAARPAPPPQAAAPAPQEPGDPGPPAES